MCNHLGCMTIGFSLLCLCACSEEGNDKTKSGSDNTKKPVDAKKPVVAKKPVDTKKPVYTVVVDDKFNRPFIRFTPPKDDQGLRPHDIVKAFLAHIENGDVEKARALVVLESQDRGIYISESIGKDGFKRACERFRAFVKGREIVLSGSAINSKGDFWAIRYKTVAARERTYNRAFVLTRRSGKWVLSESIAWKRWAGEEYNLDEAVRANRFVPLW